MKIIDRERLAWAAGLFEGEGCIFVSKKHRNVSISVKMTDEDSVRRFHSYIGLGKVTGPVPRKNPRWKPYWVWAVYNFEYVQAALALLWDGLGQRRQDKAIETIQFGSTFQIPLKNRIVCKQGHAFDAENTYLRPKEGRPGRECKICRRKNQRKWRRKMKEVERV